LREAAAKHLAFRQSPIPPGGPMNTRTIAIVALVIAVIVLIVLLV
jgi:hypothetical protein